MANPETTSEIPSSGGTTEFALKDNSLLVLLGASGDLAKKKVSIACSFYSFDYFVIVRKNDLRRAVME